VDEEKEEEQANLGSPGNWPLINNHYRYTELVIHGNSDNARYSIVS